MAVFGQIEAIMTVMISKEDYFGNPFEIKTSNQVALRV